MSVFDFIGSIALSVRLAYYIIPVIVLIWVVVISEEIPPLKGQILGLYELVYLSLFTIDRELKLVIFFRIFFTI